MSPTPAVFRLTIRAEQMRIFERAAADVFRAWALAHLKRFFPATCARIGNDTVVSIINEGIERAGRHGVHSGRGVAQFLDMMFLFGRRFDEDAGLPWAAEILNRDSLKQGARMDALFAAGGRRMGEARGLDGRTAADAW